MKAVERVSDLAIMGAPPLFAEVRHVGRPNVGDRHLFQRYVDEMFTSNWLTNDGPLVQRFESALAGYLGVDHCIVAVNGTIALELAIRALGMKSEVIVPSFTFVATAHALKWQGIEPIFVDIDSRTHNVDVDAVESLITDRTGGIVAVHLWGRPAEVTRLEALASRHDLPVLFDAAHAFGVTVGGRPVGTFGNAEVFSFHATKFFNSFEGGAVTTNDEELARRIRLSRNFGFAGFDDVESLGTNGKMTEVCAAMGLVNLASIPQIVERNRCVHEAYSRSLSDAEGVEVLQFNDDERNNFQYVVLETDSGSLRDFLVTVLHAENVLARKYFWPGCHGMHAYSASGFRAGDLSRTEDVSGRVLVLPSGSSVTDQEAVTISQVIRAAIEMHQGSR